MATYTRRRPSRRSRRLTTLKYNNHPQLQLLYVNTTTCYWRETNRNTTNSHLYNTACLLRTLALLQNKLQVFAVLHSDLLSTTFYQPETLSMSYNITFITGNRMRNTCNIRTQPIQCTAISEYMTYPARNEAQQITLLAVAFIQYPTPLT